MSLANWILASRALTSFLIVPKGALNFLLSTVATWPWASLTTTPIPIAPSFKKVMPSTLILKEGSGEEVHVSPWTTGTKGDWVNVMPQFDWLCDVCGCVMSPTSGIYWVELDFINNCKEPQLWLVLLRYSADMASVFPWVVTYGIRAGPLISWGLRDTTPQNGP